MLSSAHVKRVGVYRMQDLYHGIGSTLFSGDYLTEPTRTNMHAMSAVILTVCNCLQLS